jgi:hypothetical protein
MPWSGGIRSHRLLEITLLESPNIRLTAIRNAQAYLGTLGFILRVTQKTRESKETHRHRVSLTLNAWVGGSSPSQPT